MLAGTNPMDATRGTDAAVRIIRDDLEELNIIHKKLQCSFVAKPQIASRFARWRGSCPRDGPQADI